MSYTSEQVFVFAGPMQWERVGEGVKRKILGYDDNLMLIDVEFRKGSVGPIHRHPHTQVTYIKSGSFDVTIGAEKKVMRAGDCFFIPPNIDHGVVALEQGSLVDVFTPVREDILANRK